MLHRATERTFTSIRALGHRLGSISKSKYARITVNDDLPSILGQQTGLQRMIRRNRGSNQTDFKVKKKLNERTLKQEQKEGTSKTFLRTMSAVNLGLTFLFGIYFGDRYWVEERCDQIRSELLGDVRLSLRPTDEEIQNYINKSDDLSI